MDYYAEYFNKNIFHRSDLEESDEFPVKILFYFNFIPD
jgi:hypothetical protein